MNVRPPCDVARAAHGTIAALPGERHVTAALAQILALDRGPSEDVAVEAEGLFLVPCAEQMPRDTSPSWRMPLSGVSARMAPKGSRRTTPAESRPSAGGAPRRVAPASRKRYMGGTTSSTRDMAKPVPGHTARSGGGRKRGYLDAVAPESFAEDGGVERSRPVHIGGPQLIAAKTIAHASKSTGLAGAGLKTRGRRPERPAATLTFIYVQCAGVRASPWRMRETHEQSAGSVGSCGGGHVDLLTGIRAGAAARRP